MNKVDICDSYRLTKLQQRPVISEHLAHLCPMHGQQSIASAVHVSCWSKFFSSSTMVCWDPNGVCVYIYLYSTSYYLKLRSQSYRLTYYGWCWSGFDTENIWKSILLCIMWFNRGLACTQDNWIYPRPPKARSSRHDWDLKICKEIQYYRFGRSNRLSSKHWT